VAVFLKRGRQLRGTDELPYNGMENISSYVRKAGLGGGGGGGGFNIRVRIQEFSAGSSGQGGLCKLKGGVGELERGSTRRVQKNRHGIELDS